ncbi:MAG: DUF5929 domain-containing protein [Flavobacteriaceae bacterium]
MINKRLLIKNLLAHNDENSFYDKKRQINIGEKEGKAKFLKHICALSNSNPNNNSYIIVGVDDSNNNIIGVDFFDDSKIQNLVNAYLAYPPAIQYENIAFPNLREDKVVGLVTIRAKTTSHITALKKNIWKYYGGAVFFREGSVSKPKGADLQLQNVNSQIVHSIEHHAKNNIQYTLDGVFDFMAKRKDYSPVYKVFKEYFVICWAGKTKVVKDQMFYSRVDIALINEQVRLFYSALDEVEIIYNSDQFRMIEYVNLGLNGQNKYLKLEETRIQFFDNAQYTINTELLFQPPIYDKKTLHHIFNSNNSLLDKLRTSQTLNSQELEDLKNLPITYLICHFNGFDQALSQLEQTKSLLKKYNEAYALYKESIRILRKVKYN